METCQGLFSYWVWQIHMSVPGHGNQLLTTLRLSQGNHVTTQNVPSAYSPPTWVLKDLPISHTVRVWVWRVDGCVWSIRACAVGVLVT